MSKHENSEICTITDEAIAQRAYEIWQSRGCPDGDGSENWEAAKLQLAAESQPTQSPTDTRRGPLLRLFDRLRSRAA